MYANERIISMYGYDPSLEWLFVKGQNHEDGLSYLPISGSLVMSQFCLPKSIKISPD